jgi:glycosyltransferase 2 family protein
LIKIWLGVAVSVAALWLTLRDVDFASAWAATQNLNPIWLVPYFAIVFGEVFVRGWRWQVLLAPIQRASLRGLTSATFIGLMANNILPARAGEFLRAYAGARSEKIPFSTSFATVVIDRVFDGLTASAIFVIVILIYPLPDLWKVSGYAAAGVYLVALVGLVGLIWQKELTLKLVGMLLHFVPAGIRGRVLGWLGAFVSGLAVFRSPFLLLASTALSVVIWFGYGLTLYFTWLAFDLHLPVSAAFVVLLMLTVGITLPSTPGFAGVMELAVVTGMSELLGVDRSTSFAVAVFYHLSQFVPITIAGFVALWIDRISLADIRRVEEESEKQQPPDPAEQAEELRALQTR